MFAPDIRVECLSFFEPKEGVWRSASVETPTRETSKSRQEPDEEDFEAFCRRSLL